MGISSIRTLHKQTSLLNMKTILLFDVFTFALALPYGNIGGDSVQPQIIDVGKLQPQGSQNQPQVGGAVPNKPQLGSGGQTQAQRAPSPGVSCRTEYTTIWDTEYIETEKQECNTIYVNSCSTQYRKKCANVPRQECTTVQDRQCSTEQNMTATLKLNVPLSTRMTVSSSGKEKEMLRFGFLSLEHVNPTPMKNVKMFPSRRRDRLPILCVTRFQNRSVLLFPSRSVELFRNRSVPMNPTRSVTRFPSRIVNLFTRKFPTESVEEFLRRSVMMDLLALVPLLLDPDLMLSSLSR